jgi:4-hydroxybenzoate polyprenyltransferase
MWTSTAGGPHRAAPHRQRARQPKAAWVWLVALCLIGLVVLLQLHWQAQLVALGSLALVAAYPFMKRITGWPQAWLGLVFTWGAPVGWVEVAGFGPAGWACSMRAAGAGAWAMTRSTPARTARTTRWWASARRRCLSGAMCVAGGGALCAGVACWAGAVWLVRHDALALLALVPVALHLAWQVATLRPDDGAGALARFRSNRFAGLLMALACWVVGNA